MTYGVEWLKFVNPDLYFAGLPGPVNSPDTSRTPDPVDTGDDSTTDPSSNTTESGSDITSTGANGIDSTSPYPDFHAVLGGGGRNRSEAEVQAIRDYRAANGGALPDGFRSGTCPPASSRRSQTEPPPHSQTLKTPNNKIQKALTGFQPTVQYLEARSTLQTRSVSRTRSSGARLQKKMLNTSPITQKADGNDSCKCMTMSRS